MTWALHNLRVAKSEMNRLGTPRQACSIVDYIMAYLPSMEILELNHEPINNLAENTAYRQLILVLEDLLEERLRYIAVKPNASISVLRQKVWHLLELPDFCEEIIVLKSNKDAVVPLVELRKGNDPQHPYILEVFPPANRMQASPAVRNNMLTIGNGDEQSDYANRVKTTDIVYENVRPDKNNDSIVGGTGFEKHTTSKEYLPGEDSMTHLKGYLHNGTKILHVDWPLCGDEQAQSTLSNETMALNKLHIQDNQMQAQHPMFCAFKKSDLSCRISSTSMFKLGGRKSRDNFANILLKLQGDLSTLSTKLSVLEQKLPL